MIRFPLRALFISVCLLPALAFATPSGNTGTTQSSSETTITLTTPAWDSPLLPLDINAYYLTVTSDATADSFSIERELYVRGEKAKQFARIIGSGNFNTPQPMRLNIAIYLQDNPTNPAKTKGTTVLESSWHQQDPDGRGSNSGTTTTRSNFYLEKEDLDLQKYGHSHATFDAKISTPGKTPLFYIISAGRKSSGPGDSISIASGKTPDEVLENNPEASILFFYLLTKTQSPKSTENN